MLVRGGRFSGGGWRDTDPLAQAGIWDLDLTHPRVLSDAKCTFGSRTASDTVGGWDGRPGGADRAGGDEVGVGLGWNIASVLCITSDCDCRDV